MELGILRVHVRRLVARLKGVPAARQDGHGGASRVFHRVFAARRPLADDDATVFVVAVGRVLHADFVRALVDSTVDVRVEERRRRAMGARVWIHGRRRELSDECWETTGIWLQRRVHDRLLSRSHRGVHRRIREHARGVARRRPRPDPEIRHQHPIRPRRVRGGIKLLLVFDHGSQSPARAAETEER